jgi:hypothetical protein
MFNDVLGHVTAGTRPCVLIAASYTGAIIFAAIVAIMAKTHERRLAATRVLRILTRCKTCSCQVVRGERPDAMPTQRHDAGHAATGREACGSGRE